MIRLHRFEFGGSVYEVEIKSHDFDSFEIVELYRRYAHSHDRELFGSLHPEDAEWTRVVRHLEPLIPGLFEEATP